VPTPTLISISPSAGLAVGDDYVELVGTGFFLKAQGSVKVTFGDVPAQRSGVVSATRIIAVVPPGDPDAGVAPNVGKVDVRVENFDANGVSQGAATLFKAFQYKRPRIDYPSDLSNHPALELVRRTLVAEFQRSVIKNVRSDMHPEYADAASAADGTTNLAQLPSLKIVGPQIRDDYMRSNPEPPTVDVGGGDFLQTFAARAVELRYTIVGVGRDPTEAGHLWTEVKRYFEHNDFLNVVIPSSKLGQETAVLELEPDWNQLGEFRGKMTQQGVAQFSFVFHVRGLIPNGDRKYWASKEVEEVAITTTPMQPDQLSTIEEVTVEVLEGTLPEGATLGQTLADLEARLARAEADSPRPVAFSFDGISPRVLFQLAAGDVLEEVAVIVTTAFDDPQPDKILVGTTATPDLVFAAGDVPSDVPGEYVNRQAFQIASATELLLTINRGASTRGSGYVLFRVRRS
jgi:hypothetical protein